MLRNSLIAIVYLFIIMGTLLIVTACSDSNAPVSKTSMLNPFPELPTGKTNSVRLHAKVADWLFEGDAGCFGTLTDGITNIEVYSEADLCENRGIDNGAIINIDVIFEADMQLEIGDGERLSYTITDFHV